MAVQAAVAASSRRPTASRPPKWVAAAPRPPQPVRRAACRLTGRSTRRPTGASTSTIPRRVKRYGRGHRRYRRPQPCPPRRRRRRRPPRPLRLACPSQRLACPPQRLTCPCRRQRPPQRLPAPRLQFRHPPPPVSSGHPAPRRRRHRRRHRRRRDSCGRRSRRCQRCLSTAERSGYTPQSQSPQLISVDLPPPSLRWVVRWGVRCLGARCLAMAPAHRLQHRWHPQRPRRRPHRCHPQRRRRARRPHRHDHRSRRPRRPSRQHHPPRRSRRPRRPRHLRRGRRLRRRRRRRRRVRRWLLQ